MTDYLHAILWGLVQGLTEFLPVSSSGHLVIVPEALGIEPPDLALSAVLHLGTLAAVVVYYRADLISLLRWRDPIKRRMVGLLVIATAPAGLALLVRDRIDALQRSTTAIGIALLVTAILLWLSGQLRDRTGTVEGMSVVSAITVGFSQLLAVIPGLSRSGTTITVGMFRGLSPTEAARFSFLMGVPTIAIAGVFEGLDVVGTGRLDGPVLVGVAVAALSGYAAIAWMLKMITRSGLRPFAWYCLVVGAATLVWL